MNKFENNIIQQNDEHFRALLTALPNVSVQGYDKDRRVVYWNHASELLYGYTEAEAMGNLLEDLIIPDFMRQGVIDAHHAWVNDGVAIPAGELELKHKQDHLVPVYSSHVMLYQHTDNPEMYCVDVDLSGQRNKEKQVKYLTQFDKQTGLHNKDSLFSYAKKLTATNSKEPESHVAIFVGIDDLTHTNNAYGYSAGDKVIAQVVERLTSSIRPQDYIARYSGDVFVILITLDTQSDLLEQTLANIRKSGRTPCTVNNEQKIITLSAGICINEAVFDPEASNSNIDFLKNAEAAMNHAKNAGKNQYLFYEPEFDHQLQRSYSILSALNTAAENNEFCLVYQPQFDQAQNIVSCEALLRWQHPTMGAISPAEFIPLAESKNKMQGIDSWVVNAVIKQVKQWLHNGVNPAPVFINLSGQSLCDIDFINQLVAQLDYSAIPYEKIGIEITEYALILENDVLIQQMKWLQTHGIAIALDDFGTGYSSLSYLTQFPIDFIKIDKSFVFNAPCNQQDAAIIKAIFALSASLELKVICEGVETEQHLGFIQQQTSSAIIQGYLFSKPIPPSDFEKLILIEPIR
ncbi:putative bifunctional diguanylate cyclase/phosphodiesterase [Algibacillus agarilyticus]|uniref:putative bifunctional diguanylate cyclase/phosphodiesterase n=1 Tax=Algibacillus agarilyticus TaxID=2234133 RepID=UPI000DCF691D|nr:GGDEF domain-containing phosphodiesterase [Algibacillus agarilyticus]